MKCTDLPARLQQLLHASCYVTIATVCPDGQPWNTPVVARFDKNLNLYWISWRHNQHSRNIAADARIFVVAYDTSASEGEGLGLYLQMRAAPLETTEAVQEALKTYDASFFRLPDGTLPTFTGACPNRIYKAAPQAVWQNDGKRIQGHYIDIRRRLTP